MGEIKLRLAIMLTAVGLLTSCGAAYHSSRVIQGASDTAKVRVLPITAENVMIANRNAYTPRDLPAAFNVTAGTGGGLRGGGAIPAPALDPQSRPQHLETRLPPAVTPAPYRIGVGDVVLLATPSGSSVEQLSGLLAAQNSRQGYTVQSDGSIAIPDVGRVEIAGQSVEEAEATLFQRLVKAQIEPTFSLEIAEFNSKKVAVGGAVAKPGVLPITLAPLDLKQALAQVGGSASRNMEHTLVRLYRAGTLYQIPLEQVHKDGRAGQIPLVAGDSLFVDDTYSLDRAEAYFRQQMDIASFRQGSRSAALRDLSTEVALRRAELNEARDNYRAKVDLDAVARDYVYLAGEVKQQGRMELPLGRQASLADALFNSGKGISTKTADPRHVYVLRGSSDPMAFDALTAWQLDLRNAVNMTLATRFQLRPNDVVFIAEQPVTRWSRTVDQISPTLISAGAGAID
ncbi:polysaccharide biosynthesis/export family protein [Aliiroseovarius crassostreae]|uniref:polysaccharide biosynthesis/export family protein n=1 Tax=Aliiroseovarius crassostreae TaxID=154981 RepID=UPI003C7DFB70